MIKKLKIIAAQNYCQFVRTNTSGLSHMTASSASRALKRTDLETIQISGICPMTPLGFGLQAPKCCQSFISSCGTS